MSRNSRYEMFANKIDEHRKKISQCNKCGGEGYLPIVKEGKLIGYGDCLCRKEFFEIKNIILSNIPIKRVKLLTGTIKKRLVINPLTGKQVSLYKKIVKRYINKFDEARENGLGMMFFGHPGSGKTIAGMYIMLSLIRNGYDCYYIYFKDLIGLLIESYSDEEKKPLFKEIINVDLLVIDELSLVSRVTPHMIAEFSSVCKQRFESGKPTIIISNYKTTEEIYKNFGSPMESLLNEAFAAFKFIDTDMRVDKLDYIKTFFE